MPPVAVVAEPDPEPPNPVNPPAEPVEDRPIVVVFDEVAAPPKVPAEV